MLRRILCCALAGLLLAAPALAESTASIGAWIAYWDAAAGGDEALALASQMDSLIYFGAFFDVEDALFLPEELPAIKATLDEATDGAQVVPYLSIINDLTLEGGGYSQKDTDLLYRLLQTPQTRGAHVQDILRVAREAGCAGIEIDYERLDGDLALWGMFLAFVEELLVETEALGMPVRVLLVPGTPVEQLAFPPGCEYVMMCYNLYGSHSGPGPKADEAFLRDMAAKMAVVPEPHGFALATGGFDWSAEGVAQLTWQQAEALREASASVSTRDEASGALHFTYTDDAGASHTVWYADADTIAFWTGVLQDEGELSIDLWRLGGNGFEAGQWGAGYGSGT